MLRSAELAFSLPSFNSSDHLPRTDYKDEQFIKDFDKYTLGKIFFDLKEFDRAAFFLEGCTSQKAYFLYLYARFMVCLHSFMSLKIQCSLLKETVTVVVYIGETGSITDFVLLACQLAQLALKKKPWGGGGGVGNVHLLC